MLKTAKNHFKSANFERWKFSLKPPWWKWKILSKFTILTRKKCFILFVLPSSSIKHPVFTFWACSLTIFEDFQFVEGKFSLHVFHFWFLPQYWSRFWRKSCWKCFLDLVSAISTSNWCWKQLKTTLNLQILKGENFHSSHHDENGKFYRNLRF